MIIILEGKVYDQSHKDIMKKREDAILKDWRER